MTRIRRLLPLAVVVVLATLPFSTLTVPGVFEHALRSPGTLQLLALCLIYAALALSYDLLFGRTGLMSFGHALYFACGVYLFTIGINHWHWPPALAAGAALAAAAVLAGLLGTVAMRTEGIAFAMVTLAFAQAGAVAVSRNPGGLTGGTDGLSLDARQLPSALVGVTNTVNLYWLALGYLVVVTLVLRVVADSSTGRVLTAIRDNEQRVGVLGLNPLRYKLGAFTAAAMLAAGAGVLYALTVGGASPRVATSDLTLTLLIMVVLGGPGTRWGPIVGAVAYTYLDHRLTSMGVAARDADLPAWLGQLLSQPMLLLGLVFMLVVVLAPDGVNPWRGRLVRFLRPARQPG